MGVSNRGYSRCVRGRVSVRGGSALSRTHPTEPLNTSGAADELGRNRFQVLRLLQQVDEAVGTGRSLDEIDEELITPAPVPKDQKAALWLYVFSYQSHEAQRRLVREGLMIAGIDGSFVRRLRGLEE
jgi:hypothetical protein